MADLKISQLTSATLPLAGTEVLPIVQSSSTRKVATDDLTVKNVRSNATTGILQVAGPAAGATRIMTTPDANFTAARTDAAQSFTGDQTLATGNLVQGTAAKGVNFTANTPRAGMTSQLLNWYEEGTFTPTITGSSTDITLTYTTQTGRYTRVGRLVTVTAYVQVNTISAAGSGFLVLNTGLWNSDGTPVVGAVTLGKVTYTSFASAQMRGSGSSSVVFYSSSTAGAPAIINATDVVNGSEIYVTITYIAA